MLKLLITIIGALIIKTNYKNGRFIGSVTVYVACYLLIFVVYPLSQTEEYYKNASVIDIYALVGIITFWFGTKMIRDRSNVPLRLSHYRTLFFGRIIYVYIAVFVISVVLFFKQVGMSRILLVLSGAMTGKELALGGDLETSTYGYFTDLMIPLVLVMCISAKDKKEKIMSYMALSSYVAFTIVFGFTRIFTISILAMVVIFKIRYMSKIKQFTYAASGATILLFLMISMNFFRCMGIGGELTLEQLFDIGYILESSDFGASYIWFDKLLDIDPPYIRLDTYLKPVLYVFIPRDIWPDKPEQTSMQILKILDPELASEGFSTAGYSVLGEGYAMLGYLGIPLFPMIWGIVCKKMDIAYYRRLRSGYDICIQNTFYYIFATFLMLCCQRGDWNQYLIMVLWFFFLPIYLLSKKVNCYNENSN